MAHIFWHSGPVFGIFRDKLWMNGKPVVGFGILSARDGELDHIELRDTPPAGYKEKRALMGSSYKIRKIEPPAK